MASTADSDHGVSRRPFRFTSPFLSQFHLAFNSRQVSGSGAAQRRRARVDHLVAQDEHPPPVVLPALPFGGKSEVELAVERPPPVVRVRRRGDVLGKVGVVVPEGRVRDLG